eukprot:TRINITY_DN56320_c0_g1_i1.p1 TRINITY_DN56320_c0_g1~~TRINITY_DN56320_c0_g1_i1.p1  ORF type:complete len:101 (+),score=8.06 TRINITY_DN56320_c0_g1_i1:143-445(+)
MIESLKLRLESNAYANDDQECEIGGGAFGGFAFEHRFEEICSDLRALGYERPLEMRGHFFEHSGAIYWIFDTEELSSAEAFDLTQEWERSNRTDYLETTK